MSIQIKIPASSVGSSKNYKPKNANIKKLQIYLNKLDNDSSSNMGARGSK